MPPEEEPPATHAIHCPKTLDVVTSPRDGLTSCEAHMARNRGGNYRACVTIRKGSPLGDIA
jgi:hypothetical protein